MEVLIEDDWKSVSNRSSENKNETLGIEAMFSHMNDNLAKG